MVVVMDLAVIKQQLYDLSYQAFINFTFNQE